MPGSLARLRGRLDALAEPGAARIELVHGSITDRRAAFSGFDCATLIETIEHLQPDRLSALERSVFGEMHPATVVVTTPNAEFNSMLGVPSGRFRHPDHRFEWDRARFSGWGRGVADRNGYSAAFRNVAGAHPVLGGASQMAVFASRTLDRGPL